MDIGVPKEIKTHEYRVGMTPMGVAEAVHHGHRVIVETNAGAGINATDDDYRAAGAEVVDTAEEVFARATLVVKVKEPQPVERAMLRPDHVLFTYLHLAPDPKQTLDLVEAGTTCIAYETVTAPSGHLPLLAPMSQVAGRMSIQVGAHCLEKEQGGRGMLLGGVPGVAPAKVVIIGGGFVGANAAYMALGMAAEVIVMDRDPEVMQSLTARFGPALKTVFSTKHTLEEHVTTADLVIGAVLVPSAAAPKLVTRDMVKAMQPGTVVVDVAIDQGGSCETSRPTTHAEPTYIDEQVVHYAVTNMPGAVAHTSTYALTNATLPFTLALADKGAAQALADDPHLRAGLNIFAGKVTCQAVAEAQGLDYTTAQDALGI